MTDAQLQQLRKLANEVQESLRYLPQVALLPVGNAQMAINKIEAILDERQSGDGK